MTYLIYICEFCWPDHTVKLSNNAVTPARPKVCDVCGHTIETPDIPIHYVEIERNPEDMGL